MQYQPALKLLKSVIKDFSQDNCMRVSAALSYYAIFALPPLLILIVSICGFFFDTADVEGRVAAEMASVIGSDGADQVRNMIHSADTSNRNTLMNIVGVFALLFGASGVVVQLQGALNDVWEIKPDPKEGGVWNFITKRMLSFAMVIGIAFLLLISLVLTSTLSLVSESILPSALTGTFMQVMNFLISFIVIALLFAAMFKFLPDAKVTWRDTWLGATVTAGLFVLGKFVMGLYFVNSSVGSAYGAASSVILLFVWVYYSGIIIMLGAEFTQGWADMFGAGIQPSEGAVRVITETEEVKPDDKPDDVKGPFVTVG